MLVFVICCTCCHNCVRDWMAQRMAVDGLKADEPLITAHHHHWGNVQL